MLTENELSSLKIARALMKTVYVLVPKTILGPPVSKASRMGRSRLGTALVRGVVLVCGPRGRSCKRCIFSKQRTLDN